MAKGAETEKNSPRLPADSARRVFISYASHDAPAAQDMCLALEAAGFPCWMAPRDVKAGALYADAIVRAISSARAFVLVLSENSINSSHVGKEIERASSKRCPVIALRIDAAALTPAFEYFLSESQWVEAQTGNIKSAYARLIEAIRETEQQAAGIGSGVHSGASTIEARAVLPKARRKWIMFAAGLAAVAVAALFADRYWLSQHPTTEQPTSGKSAASSAAPTISEKSIAVLPFVDMSEKKDQEYFADGMSEELLDLLAKIPGLAVIGRTSSFQFKDKNEDLRTIGANLNAAYVLEGSVRKSGDQVRISAQLINAKTGAHEWSETYDRHIGDVLKLQDAIAASVVRELQLTVAPEYVNFRSTINDADAYVLMLRGRHAADRFDREGLDEAIALFKQVLERDPKSADAFAELAFAYYAEGINNFLSSTAAFEPARRAAETALGLNSKNALAHYVLGKIHVVFDWDWAAAEREFNQIATQAPGSAYAQGGSALLSMAIGRWDDALRHIEGSLALDPLDPDAYQNLMEIQLGRGRLPEAEAAIRRSLDIRPTYGFGHFLLGLVKLHRGDPEGALLEMQQETTEGGQQEGLAMAYFALGRRADSDAALGMLKQYPGRSAYSIAVVYAFRRQSDEAMLWLERAYAQKDAFLQFAKAELLHMHLADDPRFKAFLRKMNMPE